MDERELFADLCESMTIAVEEQPDVFGAEAMALPGVNPVLVAVFKMWVIRQFKNLACENKQAILAAVEQWIGQFVRNETLATVLSNVALAIADSFCP